LARFKHYGFPHDREQTTNDRMKGRTHDPETLANWRQILKREARLRRFGYDSPAAIRFVLAQAMPLGGKVLEIGTGKGRFLIRLAQHVKTVISVDVSAEEQRCARLNARYAGVERKIRFVLQDAGRLPWGAGTFDAAVTMNAMHHIAHFKRVLGEMVRVVRPGGKIVLADFSPRGFQIISREHRDEGKTHPREHHDFRELRRLLRTRGLITRLRKGANQEVLVGVLPAAVKEGTR
jgi:ubiquinone/menaquinone biosynthesis C-methylase UbiE